MPIKYRVVAVQAVLPVSNQGAATYAGINLDTVYSQSTTDDPVLVGQTMYCMKRSSYTGCTTGAGHKGLFLAVIQAR